jgi:hypothetical protein
MGNDSQPRYSIKPDICLPPVLPFLKPVTRTNSKNFFSELHPSNLYMQSYESPALNMLTMFITFAKRTQRFEPFRDLNSAESPLKY